MEELGLLQRTLYGQVTLHRDLSSGILVARKYSSAKKWKSRGLHEDPANEVRLLQKLSNTSARLLHSGSSFVVRLLGSGSDEEGNVWSALQYCGGGELFALVDRNGKLDPKQALLYFTQVALGVDFIHTNGISHLDLSLENCLLSEGRALITDFGLSLEGRHFQGKRGKPSYMAPEVYAGRRYDGHLADVWSLGCLLFMMLTQAPVCERPNCSDAMVRLLLEEGRSGFSRVFKVWGVPVPEEILDLLSTMICPAKDRSSLRQVLQHAALRDVLQTVLKSTVVQRDHAEMLQQLQLGKQTHKRALSPGLEEEPDSPDCLDVGVVASPRQLKLHEARTLLCSHTHSYIVPNKPAPKRTRRWSDPDCSSGNALSEEDAETLSLRSTVARDSFEHLSSVAHCAAAHEKSSPVHSAQRTTPHRNASPTLSYPSTGCSSSPEIAGFHLIRSQSPTTVGCEA
eukprot:g36967.t1